MRPGSATSLPDSTASTGLLCLSVGAREHHGRSDIEVDRMATTMCTSHSVHDICIDIVGFVGQITVTGGCCLNGDEMIAHTLDASGMGK